jgi:hypothetical protein
MMLMPSSAYYLVAATAANVPVKLIFTYIRHLEFSFERKSDASRVWFGEWSPWIF